MKVTIAEGAILYCGFLWEAARFLTRFPEIAKSPVVVDPINDDMLIVWARQTRPDKDWVIFCAPDSPERSDEPTIAPDSPERSDEPTIWAKRIVHKDA